MHKIVAFDEIHRPWAAHLLAQEWGSTLSVSRGRVHAADRLPGFVAMQDGEPVGLVTYHIEGDECEVVTINSLIECTGIGTALLAVVAEAARAAGCRRVWLITTNDNTHALHFYQKRGYRLAALYPNALEASRRLKPEIPMTGLDGIPLRDEIELEVILRE